MTDWSAYPVAKSGAGQAVASPPDDPWASYPTERRSMGEALMRQLGLGTRYLIEGASTPVEIIGNAANGVANMGIRGVNAVAGTQIPEFETYGDYRKRALDKVLPNPETPEERVIGEMSKFVAGTGAMAGGAKLGEMMGTKALAPMADNLAGQAIAAETGGGAYGIAKEKTDNPLIQFAAALLGSAAGGAGMAAAEKMLPSNSAKVPTPTTQQIKDMSQAAYRESDDAGLIIKPDRMQQLSASVKEKLAEYAFDPEDQPMIARAIARLDKAGAENITLKGVDAIRKKLVNVLQDGNNTERMMARKILSYIDDTMTSLVPDDVVQGDTEVAVKALTDARSLWKVQAKSQLIDDLVQQAKDQAARTNSGGNLQNTLKQKLGTILTKPKLSRMFDKDELEAIRQIVRGTVTENTLRTLGRLAPSSNAQLGPLLAQMGMMGGGGYAAGGIPGAAMGVGVPLVGAGAKAAGTALTQGAVNRLSNMVRSAAAPKVGPVVPQANPTDLLVQTLLQGTRPLLPNAYADALLRSGAVAVPASDSPNTGPRRQP